MNDNIKLEIGEKIRRTRKKIKMSMRTLGEKVNLHESTISRYEKGEIQYLDVNKLKEIASALGVTASFLLGWETENKKDSLHAIIETMSVDEQMKLLEYADFLVSQRNIQK